MLTWYILVALIYILIGLWLAVTIKELILEIDAIHKAWMVLIALLWPIIVGIFIGVWAIAVLGKFGQNK